MKNKMFALIEKEVCYECEGATNILFVSENKELLEQYKKYGKGNEIIEVDVLNRLVVPVEILKIDIQVSTKDRTVYMNPISYSIEKIITNDIDVKNYILNKPDYREWDYDCQLLFVVKSNNRDKYDNIANELAEGIFEIRQNAKELNNTKEVTKFINQFFEDHIKS